MELLGPLPNLVVTRPKPIILGFVVVTLLLMAASSQRERDLVVDESSFLPDNEVANADLEIREEYGQVEPSTVLVKGRGGDALTVATMREMLLVEWAASINPVVSDNLAPATPRNPAIFSLADMVALTLYMQAGAEANLTLRPDPGYREKVFALTGQDNVSVMALDETGVWYATTIDLPARSDDEVKVATLSLARGEVPGFEFMSGYLGFLLSKDFDTTVDDPADARAKATLINFNFDVSQRGDETFQDARERVKQAEIELNRVIADQRLASEMTQLGEQIVNYEVEQATTWITGVLLIAAFILIFIILAITFRSLRDLALGVGGLFLTLLWVDGFESVMGFAPTQMSQFIPVMLVGLAVDYVIHMILRYREEMLQKPEVARAVRLAVLSVGSALLLATFTTMVGFTSNAVSPMSVLSDFGLTVAFGILSAFLIFTLLVPSLKLLWDGRLVARGKEPLPRSARREGDEAGAQLLDRFLTRGALMAERQPAAVLAVVAVITLVMGSLATGLSTEFSVRDFLPQSLDISQDYDYLFDEFDFSLESAAVLIKGNVTQPGVLKALQNTTTRLQGQPHVVHLRMGNLSLPRAESVLSMFQEVAESNASFAADLAAADSDGDLVPDRNLTALYNALYENDAPSATRLLHRDGNGGYDGLVLRVAVDSKNFKETLPVKEELERAAMPLEELEADGTLAQVVVTAGPVTVEVIISSINASMMSSLAITIAVALVALTLIFYYACRSWVLGFLTTLPVLLVLVWIMGTMFLLGISLNVITLLIGALTVGLGITYAIHITHRFVEELAEHGRIEHALKRTVSHTGTALFGAAVTTMGGFGLLAFSIIPPMRQFGLITAITIFYSFLASVLVLPALLALWARRVRQGDTAAAPGAAAGPLPVAPWPAGAEGVEPETPDEAPESSGAEPGPGDEEAEGDEAEGDEVEGSELEPPFDEPGPEGAEGRESPLGVAALEEPEDETWLEEALAAATCNPGSRITRGE